jgi:hypothetical protein
LHIGPEMVQPRKERTHFETGGVIALSRRKWERRHNPRSRGESMARTIARPGCCPEGCCLEDCRLEVLVRSHIHDVHIGTKPDVIRQIPAVMVRVFENRNIVAIPEPVAAIADIEGGYAETKTAKPEQVRASTAEMPHMSAAETAGEVSVLPGMVEMIVRIILAGIVAHPLAVVVNVRSVRMPRLVIEVRRRSGRRMRRARRSRSVRGNVRHATTNAVGSGMLCKRRERK